MVFEEPVIVDGPFDEVLSKTKDAFMAQGFGTVTEIDFQATLKAKIGAEIERYVIVGACNPHLASAAHAAEPLIGVLLPCNVVVREVDDKVQVSAMDPGLMGEMIGSGEIDEVAADARTRIKNALDSLRS